MWRYEVRLRRARDREREGDDRPEADAERISRTAEFSEGLTQLLTHSTINALASMHMSQLLSDEPAVVFKL